MVKSQASKRQSKHERLLGEYTRRGREETLVRDILVTLIVPFFLAIFTWTMIAISDHNLSSFSSTQAFFTKGFVDNRFWLGFCFFLWGLMQICTGLVVIWLAKGISKCTGWSIHTMYPAKYDIPFIKTNPYWEGFTWIFVRWCPIIVPCGLLFKNYPFPFDEVEGIFTGITVLFSMVFISGLHWDEIWEERVCPRESKGLR